MKKILLSLFIMSQSVYASNYLDDNLHKLSWNDIEVVWLEDDSYPTYNLTVYFHAGALTDDKNKLGTTEFMFNEVTSGTTRYSKKEILDVLEFYGASYGGNTTHEYSTYSVSGLVKDMEPTMKMICHTFKNATFPEAEFKKTKKRALSSFQNIVNNHNALANRVFRNISLEGTPYENPVSGTKKSIQKITARDLHTKLKQFTNTVKKKIYIKGPKAIKNLESIILNDCGWNGKEGSTIVDAIGVKSEPIVDNTIYFVPVANANQAQIRMGRYLTQKESLMGYTVKEFASRFMGGGFTSRLMQELRVKRGLTYTASAYSSSQKGYGRSGINTFTKDSTLVETLKVIKATIESESTNVLLPNFEHSKNYLKGNYLFSLESSTAFLGNLLFFDHIGRNYNEIYTFRKEIDQVTPKILMETIGDLFNWDHQKKLVLGNKNLIKDLRKAGYKVKELNYKDYL